MFDFRYTLGLMIMMEAKSASPVSIASAQARTAQEGSLYGAKVRNEEGQRLDLMTGRPLPQSTAEITRRPVTEDIAMPGAVLDALGIPRGYQSRETAIVELSGHQHEGLWNDEEATEYRETSCGEDEVLIQGEGNSGEIFPRPLTPHEIPRQMSVGPSIDFSGDKDVYKIEE